MLKAEQIEVEKERIRSQQEIAGANMAMKHINDKERLQAEQEREGFRQGVQVLQKRHESRQQQNNSNRPPKKGE
jgi:hypothetical protein